MKTDKIVYKKFMIGVNKMRAEVCRGYFEKELKKMFPEAFKGRVIVYGTVQSNALKRMIDTHADCNNVNNKYVIIFNDQTLCKLYILKINAIELTKLFPNVELTYSVKNRELYKNKIRFAFDEHPNILDSKFLYKIVDYNPYRMEVIDE